MPLKFGPAGIGPVKDAVANLKKFHDAGFGVCEIAFTYGVYIKNEIDARKIGEEAKKLGIDLSIHAPYWINLNSSDKEKIRLSEQRILECCKLGTWLGATKVVFHCGFYGKNSKEKTFENIKKEILKIKNEVDKKNYTPELAPEIMGKINVFGSIEEIHDLSEQTGCSFCIDFAHILARYRNYMFEKVSECFGSQKKWHVHFSGIEYGDKGEKRHKITPESEIKIILENLPKYKDIAIINESPDSFEDSKKSIKLFKN